MEVEYFICKCGEYVSEKPKIILKHRKPTPTILTEPDHIDIPGGRVENKLKSNFMRKIEGKKIIGESKVFIDEEIKPKKPKKVSIPDGFELRCPSCDRVLLTWRGG